MRKLRRTFGATVVLLLILFPAYVGAQVTAPPVAARSLGLAIMLCGSVTAVLYSSIVSLRLTQERHERALRAQREENDRLVQRVAEENDRLVQRVMTELEGYGDRRAIDALVGAERRALMSQRAGENTLDLARVSLNGDNVTQIRRHRRRDDAG